MEPPSLSLARLAQAACFLEVPVQLRPGGGCHPHTRQALRALPQGARDGWGWDSSQTSEAPAQGLARG